jgi:DNA-binding NarL/FixJ family response regulator
MSGPLREISPELRILVLTGVRDAQAHRRAFQLGATGLVEKDAAADVLLKAIRKVAAGEIWLDRASTAILLAELTRGEQHEKGDPDAEKIARLSPREREVAELIGEGLSNRKIAERLFISETTVRHHLTSIFSKLEVHDRLELLLYAYRHGLVRSRAPD